MLRVTFLGTGGAIPQTKRNPSSIMVEMEGDLLLFDCGEGTQRQMMRYGTGFTVEDIFITHIHGDHILGLPGLFQTWSYQDRKSSINIYTPSGTEEVIQDCVNLAGHRPEYRVDISGIEPGREIQRDGYIVKPFSTSHAGAKSIGFVLEEDERKGRFNKEKALELGVPEGPMFSKLHNGDSIELEDGTKIEPEMVVGEPRPGRKIVYTGDTRPTESIKQKADNADLLIHDGMFHSDLSERAGETGHSTAEEAAEIARNAGVDLLILTHVSSRYSDSVSSLKKEARDIHPDTEIAYDGAKVIVEYPDKNRDTRIVE